jgi:hypothetical protein
MKATTLHEINDLRVEDVPGPNASKFLLTEEHLAPLTLFLLSGVAASFASQNILVDGGKMIQ